jgi:hypothetical protein
MASPQFRPRPIRQDTYKVVVTSVRTLAGRIYPSGPIGSHGIDGIVEKDYRRIELMPLRIYRSSTQNEWQKKD